MNRRFTVKATVVAGGVMLAALVAGADPVSGEGEWGISGDTLTVSNGTVSIDETLGSSIAKVRIFEGAKLSIGTDTPFAEPPSMHVYGTFDLNGHSLEVNALTTVHQSGDDAAYSIVGSSKTWYLSSVEAQVTNSVDSTVTLTVTSGDVHSVARFASNIEVVQGESATAAVFPFNRTGGAGPRKIDVTASMLAVSRPTDLIFVFKGVAGTGSARKLRLTELMPTYHGVPIAELGYGVKCTLKTTNLTETVLSNWTDCDLGTAVYASTKHLVSPETPHIILVSFGSGKGYPPIDGYRLGTPYEPAYTPTTWDVYAFRHDSVGAVLVDRRVDDPVNRPKINTSTTSDSWSNQLSENYEFQWKLGENVGADTDLAVDGPARFSEGDPLVMGSVSGSGTITLDEDSVIAPKSLADWSGVFSVKDTYGFLGEGPGVLLSSVRGAAEQRFAHENVNLAVGAAEADSTVKVLYDATTADTYVRTRLRDGNGTLGVTVRAPGKEQYLAAQGSDYSGPTDVESGTLVIHGKTASSIKCAYIKIVVKEVPEWPDYFNCYWGMNEFKIYDADGGEIDISGATVTSSTGKFISTKTTGGNLIDGDVTTRMLPEGGSLAEKPSVTISLSQSHSIAAYDWYPSVNDTSPTTYRYPLQLEIWVSDDNVNWLLADKRTNAKPETDEGYMKWQGGDTHFSLSFLDEAQGAADLPTLDSSVCGTSSEGAAFVECVKARYFRFTCYESFYGWNFPDDNTKGWGLSEISLLRNGAYVDWPTENAGFSVTNKAGLTWWTVNGSANEKVADNIRTSAQAAETGVQNRAIYSNGLGYIQIDAGEVLEFDAYSLWTPPPGARRLPRGWMLQVSVNGTSWQTVDVHQPADDDVCPSGTYREYGPFSLQNRWPIAGAGNVIGDKSKVTVASGATLRLDATFERVGGLAGAGSVNIRDNTLELAAKDAATVFSGAVTGGGTLVISGEGEQSFDNADLSGVSTLKLAAGTMTGSATFGGNDLVLDFDGGALGASLANIGNLTVEGDVTIRPSAASIAAKRWTATITTTTALDEATKAAFRRAQFVGLPWNLFGSVVVEDNQVTIKVSPRGTRLILR